MIGRLGDVDILTQDDGLTYFPQLAQGWIPEQLCGEFYSQPDIAQVMRG